MVRLSKEEARALGLAPKASKYNNDKPTYYDPELKETLTFDSIKEFEYYLILKDREKRGEIRHLTRQVELVIQPSFKDEYGKTVKPITYIADFVYLTPIYDNDGNLINLVKHVVDVKGCKTDIYKLKKKLLAYRGIYIEEV